MNKHFAGIDPGLTGAIAVINNHGKIVNVYDYKAEPRKLFNIYQRLSKLDLTVCIENIMFMSQQSFVNQFKYLATFFQHVFLLELFGIEYKIVDSKEWKKEFSLGKEKQKREKQPDISAEEQKKIKDKQKRKDSKRQSF